MMFNQLLTATSGSTDTMGMLLGTLGPVVLMFAVFYFLLIRPQKKRETEVQKMREAIEVGDEVVTIGGIIGRVVSIKEDTLVIETSGERSKLRMARWAIQANNTAAERQAASDAAKAKAAK